MLDLLKRRHFLIFAGGVIAAKALSSKTARNLAVKGLAGGMKLMKEAQSEMQSMKEDAEDMLYKEEIATEVEGV